MISPNTRWLIEVGYIGGVSLLILCVLTSLYGPSAGYLLSMANFLGLLAIDIVIDTEAWTGKRNDRES